MTGTNETKRAPTHVPDYPWDPFDLWSPPELTAFGPWRPHHARRALQVEFNRLCEEPSDINEHLETLRSLSSRVDDVTEFGVRDVVSTVAIVLGCPGMVNSFDAVAESPRIAAMKRVCRDAMKPWVFSRADVLEMAPIDETDLLFIDTFHSYAQLSRELIKHATSVTTYIVLHDTTTFGDRGMDGKSPGLWQAVEEFVEREPHWRVIARHTHNNGLTVLERGVGA